MSDLEKFKEFKNHLSVKFGIMFGEIQIQMRAKKEFKRLKTLFLALQ